MERGFWPGRRVFVTGAGGFIGDWLCAGLAEKGAEVTEGRFGRDSNPFLQEKKTAKRKTDIMDFSSVDRVLGETMPEVLVHLAGKSLVDDDEIAMRVNSQGTMNVLEACRKNSVGNVAVASTARVYDGTEEGAKTEESEMKGASKYDESKAECDRLARKFAVENGMRVNVTRCTHTYGPRDYRLGHLAPRIITQAIGGKTVSLYGDGSLERELLYITDAVDAYTTLIEKAEKKNIVGEAFNFSSEKSISVRELAEKIVGICGSRSKITFSGKTGRKEGNQRISSKKALEVLGWKPKTGLDEGLQKTIEWYRKNWAKE